MKYVTLKNGDRVPALGLGTWRADKGVVTRAVAKAVELGYRHVDCAHCYGNEAEIGEAFQRLAIPREQLWVTSKLWNNAQSPDSVRPALEHTLANLRLDHLDLYLIHWPVQLRKGVMYPQGPDDLIPWTTEHMLELWGALEECVRQGLVRNIGTSNFSTKKLQVILDNCAIAPAMSQVEIHPCQQQKVMFDFCRENGLGLTGFCPLGSSSRPAHQQKRDEPCPLTEPVVLDIAERYGVTPGKILLAWALTRGTIAIPKSTSETHLRENLEAADLTLNVEDMQAMASLDRGYRFIDGSHWMMAGSPYSMENLWDEE